MENPIDAMSILNSIIYININFYLNYFYILIQYNFLCPASRPFSLTVELIPQLKKVEIPQYDAGSGYNTPAGPRRDQACGVTTRACRLYLFYTLCKIYNDTKHSFLNLYKFYASDKGQ